MLEILFIALILYCAYQVIAIPLYAFGFWGTVFLVLFGIPLLVILVPMFFDNIGWVYVIATVLAVLTIIGYAVQDSGSGK